MPTLRAQHVRLDYAKAIFRLRCAVNWSRISQHSRHCLAQLFFAPSILTLHTSANRSALGHKVGPVACDDALKRVVGAVFCRRYGRKLADYVQPWGQYGVAASSGLEIMARTTLGFKEGLHNSFVRRSKCLNSICHHMFLPALAEIVPSEVPYASNLYGQ